ncbi:MAG TPA: hypothetical protein VJT49_32255 [Amycolatopsis sp.]|uniref:LGFP repeat-containing protein n=1 Tax=Amycolatopsis sp. TaxID=37632 RepID=UPI002B464389|nr:hypothetical protein [Amycolatopsis sp.]HKS49696.1 hypothetical protein [Amycolatopsis sp.]
MAHIGGQRADENDNDPVEVRHYQILGGGLDDALGRFPTSRILYRTVTGGAIFWQYFPNGIIISTPETCASVLYGPIFDYWDQTGEFDGYLGAPTTDVLRIPSPPTPPGSPPPPPNGTYAVFQHGVLYLGPDINATVGELSPLSQGLVASAAGIMPTGDGIAAAAQAIVQGFADNALATNQHLSDNVSSISTRVSFNSTGPGGCSGAGFNAVGRSLLRSHIFNVHFDFKLKGCAGTFGDASADLRIEVRLFVDPPNVTARLVHYWIDSVASPFSAGDHDIRDGLSQALNGQYGRDLLNRSMPKGLTVIGAIVEVNGDVNLYIAPLCAATSVLMSTHDAASLDSLVHMRRLRDVHLREQDWGRDLVLDQEFLGPILTEALRDQRDAPDLRRKLAHLLTETFTPGAELAHLAAILQAPADRLRTLLSTPVGDDPAWSRRLSDRALAVLRELDDTTPFEEVVRVANSVLDEEIQRVQQNDRPRNSNS